METYQILILIFAIGIPLLIVLGYAEYSKSEDKRNAKYAKDYQNLSSEQKAVISLEEYTRRRLAKHKFNPDKDDSIEVQVPAIIDCPTCGKPVSNQAPNCPHCGHPIASGKCPNCGSSNIETITNTDKAVSTVLVGVFAANTVINHHRCKDCGHKF